MSKIVDLKNNKYGVTSRFLSSQNVPPIEECNGEDSESDSKSDFTTDSSLKNGHTKTSAFLTTAKTNNKDRSQPKVGILCRALITVNQVFLHLHSRSVNMSLQLTVIDNMLISSIPEACC